MGVLWDLDFGELSIKVELEKLVEWLNCDYDDILNTLANFISNLVWHELRDRGVYYSHSIKSTNFGSLIVRTLHCRIFYTLNTRNNTTKHVIVWGIVLLKRVVIGQTIDTAKWLICKPLENRDDEFEIVYVMLINLYRFKVGTHFLWRR